MQKVNVFNNNCMNHSRVRTLSCVVPSTFYEKIIHKESYCIVIIYRVVFMKPAVPTTLILRGALFRSCTAHNARSHLIKILSFHVVTFLGVEKYYNITLILLFHWEFSLEYVCQCSSGKKHNKSHDSDHNVVSWRSYSRPPANLLLSWPQWLYVSDVASGLCYFNHPI